MSEPKSNTAMVRADERPYAINLTEVRPGGETNKFTIPIPTNGSWEEWSPVQQAAVLHYSGGPWQGEPIPVILNAIMFSRELGLKILTGDIYPIRGRLAVSNKAKIKYAMNSGKISDIEYKVEERDETFEHTYKIKGQEYTHKTKEMIGTITFKVKGWTKPHTYSTRLSQWIKGENPNWIENTPHMFRIAVYAHGMEEVVPVGGADPDEAPPLVEVAPKTPTLEEQLKSSIREQNKKKETIDVT